MSSSDQRERSKQWLHNAVAAAGLTGQADLRRAWQARFNEVLSTGRASKWWNGTTPRPAQLAKLVDVLGANLDIAMREAGYGEPRAETEKIYASRWSEWIRDAAKGTRYDLETAHPEQALEAWELISEGTLDQATVRGWWDGYATPTASAAILAAKALGRDMIEAARVAGHIEIADIAEHILAGDRMTAARAALADYNLPPAEEVELIRSYAQDLAQGYDRALEVLRLKAQVAQNRTGSVASQKS